MVGSEPVMRDTPHHIRNHRFVNAKCDVFLLMRPINAFYGSAEFRIKTPNGLPITIVRSTPLGNLWKLLLTGGNHILLVHRLLHGLYTVAFFVQRRDFGSQTAIARCKLS